MSEIALDLVLKATNGRLVGKDGPTLFAGISTDTRTLRPGALFVALEGERFDGHDFVAEALRRGARAALVSRVIEVEGPLIVVSDTLEALGAIAAARRASVEVQVIAVTGSTGKTTTKGMIAAILSRGGPIASTPGNYNNEIGVPLALLELNSSHQAAVVELAMRGRGQIAYLAEMTQPHIGVLTNIGVSHLEFLGSREAIAEAKAELLAALPGDGAAVLNADDEFFDFLRRRTRARVISFGSRAKADVQVEAVCFGADAQLRFQLRGWWGEQEIALQTAGRHQALNAAAAAAAAMAAGAQPDWIVAGLSAFEAADMRGQIIRTPAGYTVINDTYNAAPDSMKVALELLMDLPGERKWAVLGDMRELGPMTVDWHREVGRLAALLGIAGLVTVGELGRHIAAGARPNMAGRKVIEAAGNASAAREVAENIAPGDVVLVKGSRVMRMEEIVSALAESAGQAIDG